MSKSTNSATDLDVKIIYRKTGELLAVGKRGWAITPFEGNFYISRSALKTRRFKVNYVPGLCFYKFLYVWLDFQNKNGEVEKFLGWKYWLPNIHDRNGIL